MPYAESDESYQKRLDAYHKNEEKKTQVHQSKQNLCVTLGLVALLVAGVIVGASCLFTKTTGKDTPGGKACTAFLCLTWIPFGILCCVGLRCQFAAYKEAGVDVSLKFPIRSGYYVETADPKLVGYAVVPVYQS